MYTSPWCKLPVANMLSQKCFELKASSAEGQSMLPRDKKRKKRKVKA